MARSYVQRLWDAGTVGWVYYTKPFIDATPDATETTPNYTGAISSHSVVSVDTSDEKTSELFIDFVADDAFAIDDTNSSGTGTVVRVSGGHAQADEGYGILELDTGAGAGEARAEHGFSGTPFLAFRGSLRTVAEVRVKLPADPTDVTFGCGFDDNSGTSCRAAILEGVGNWIFAAESAAGGGSETNITAVAATAGWHTLRLEWDPGVEARFYVDDVLVSSEAVANAIPQGDDEMSFIIAAETVGATAGAVYVDWLRIVSERA
jgi:hypothetical protein